MGGGGRGGMRDPFDASRGLTKAYDPRTGRGGGVPPRKNKLLEREIHNLDRGPFEDGNRDPFSRGSHPHDRGSHPHGRGSHPHNRRGRPHGSRGNIISPHYRTMQRRNGGHGLLGEVFTYSESYSCKTIWLDSAGF